MDGDDRSAAVRRHKERIFAVSRRKMWFAMVGLCSHTSALSAGSVVPWSRDHWDGWRERHSCFLMALREGVSNQ